MGIQSISSQLGNGQPLPGAAAGKGGSSAPAAAAAELTAQAATLQQAQDTSSSSAAALAEALKEIESAVQAKANNLQFSVDDSTGKTVVRVIDSTSGSTIRQIPSEEALAIARDIERMRGLLLRDSA